MAICASCNGRGSVTCSFCGGRRYTHRLTANGDMDTNPCGVCAGRGTTPCQFCGGRGKVGPDIPASGVGQPRQRAPGEDALAGRWNGPQGTGYEFIKRSADYEIVEYGPLGRTGGGSATLRGKTCTVRINNMLFGPYSVDFTLDGDTLRGTLMIMGMPMPMVLTRS